MINPVKQKFFNLIPPNQCGLRCLLPDELDAEIPAYPPILLSQRDALQAGPSRPFWTLDLVETNKSGAGYFNPHRNRKAQTRKPPLVKWRYFRYNEGWRSIKLL